MIGEKYNRVFKNVRASDSVRNEVLGMAYLGKNNKKSRSGKRFAAVVLAVVIISAVAVTAYAAVNWTGFAFTGKMSSSEIAQLLEQAEAGELGASIDADGNVYYYDEQGKEVMMLTKEESELYEKKLEEEHLAEVQSRTDKIDIKALPYIPAGITELSADQDGCIEDFAIGNGYIAVLSALNGQSFALRKSETMSVSMQSDGESRLEYYLIKDKTPVDSFADPKPGTEHSCSFRIGEDGDYYLAIVYISASADNFTSGRIMTHE